MASWDDLSVALTPDRIKVCCISLMFMLVCVGSPVSLLCFAQQPTHYVQLHPNTTQGNAPSLGNMHSTPSPFCFTSQLLALGSVEGQGWNPWPGCSRSQDPPLPYICKDINTPTYVHMRAPTQVLSNNARELKNTNTQTHIYTHTHKWMLGKWRHS